MNKRVLALVAAALLCSCGFAAAQGDVTAPIRKALDAYNTGDMKSFYATYAAGEITIVDEFAPHRWTGFHAPKDWADAYDKHAKATGVTDAAVKYSAPTRQEIEGDAAYVIIPTVYVYKENGKPMQEEGEMTFVMHAEAGAWKIRGWTWSGVKPHPAK